MISFRASNLLLPLAVVVNLSSSHAADLVKADNMDSLDLPTSWTGGVVPGQFDLAVWDATVTAANTVDLGLDTAWLGISVTNPGGAVTINGGALTLGALGIDLELATQNLTLNPGVTLSAPNTWTVATGRVLTISGQFDNNGHSLTVAGAGNTNVAGGEFTGNVSLTKSGTGILNLGGATTGVAVGMDAGTTITLQGGTIANATANTWDTNLSSLSLSGGIFDVKTGNVIIDGLSGTAGTVQRSGTGANTLTIGVNGGGGTFSGVIKQTGGVFTVVKTGLGTQTFSGSGNNANLLVAVKGGTMVLAKTSSGAGASGIGNRGVYGVTELDTGATLRLAGSGNEQIYGFAVTGIAGTGVVNLTGGTLDFNGKNEGWNILSGTGTVTNSVAATTSTMTLGENNGSGVFSGVIQNGAGTIAVTKKGSGTATLAGANTYTGATTVSAGTLAVAGSLTSTISVADNAGLGGEGTVGAVTLGATVGGRIAIDPNLTAALTTGALTINGTASVSLTSSDISPGVPTPVVNFASKGNAWTAANFTMVGAGNYRSVAFSEAANTVNLTINSTSVAWTNASADSKWNTNGSVNFQDSVPSAQKFFAFDSVVFGNVPGSNQVITVDGPQQPSAWTVDSSFDYTFNNGTAGAVVGNGSLVKSGAGKLTINLVNTFQGSTTINGGIVEISSESALGTAPLNPTPGHLTLNGGGLKLLSAFSPSANRGIMLGGASSLDVSLTGNTTTTTIGSLIEGTGNLTLAANGDTSDTGGGAGGCMQLTGLANTNVGNLTIASGVVAIESNFGDAGNAIILDGGGLVDRGANFTLNRALQVGAAGGVLRTYGGITNCVIAGPVSNRSGVASTTLRRTDGGTLKLAGDGSGFSGTFFNLRGNTQITAVDANWANTDFNVNTAGGSLYFNGTGTARVKSITSGRDIMLDNGTTVDVGSGGITMASVAHWIRNSVGAIGALTSSTGVLTITNGGTSANLSTADHQIQPIIKDYNGSTPLTLVKNNDNLLILTQPNSYTGGTIINNGRIQTSSVTSMGTGPVTVNNGGQAFLTTAGTYPNDFTITGTGPFEVNHGNIGAIRFNGNNIIVGSVTVAPDGGRVVGYFAAAGAITGGLKGSGNLEINSTYNTNYTGPISISGNSAGYTGTITVSQGRLLLSSPSLGGSLIVGDGAAFTGESTFAGSISLGATGTTNLAFDPNTTAALTAGGALTVNGTVTVSLSGSVPVNGTYKVIQFGSKNGTWTAANFTLPGGGVMRPGSGFAVNANDVSLTIAKMSLEWNNAAGTSVWDTNVTANFRDSTLANQKFYSADDVLFGNVPTTAQTITVTGEQQPSSFKVNSTQNYTFNAGTGGTISGGAMLTKAGSGLLTLNLANSFNGGTLISAGEVRAAVAGAMGTGPITLGDAATGSSNVSWLFNGGGTPANNVIVSSLGTGTVTLGTYSAGTYTTPSGSLSLNRAVTLYDGTNDRTTYSGKISGNAGTITLSGSRITFANGTNDFNAALVVSAGTIYQNDAAGAIPDSTPIQLVGSNSRFRLNSNSEVIGAISGIGIIDNVVGSGNTLTLGGGNASGNFTGSVTNGSGALNIAKIGSGTQYLTGTNNYSGTTTVNGGALYLAGGQIASVVTVADGAKLGVAGVAGAQFRATDLKLGATTGAALDIRNFSTAGAAVDVAGSFEPVGTVVVSVGGMLESGTYPLITYAGAIGGDGFAALSLAPLPGRATATLVDNAANGSVDIAITADPIYWTGNTSSVWNIDTTPNWKLNASPTKYVDADIVVFDDSAVGSTAVQIATNVTPSSVTVNNTTKDYVLSGPGAIVGGSGLAKKGLGKLTILNANSYTGTTSVTEGSLHFGDGVTDGSVAGPLANDGEVVFLTVGTQTLAGGVSGAGTITKNGPGTQILAGASTFSGPTAVNEGTLQLGNGSGSNSFGGGNYTLAAGSTLFLNYGAAVPAGSGTWSSKITGSGAVRINTAQPINGSGNWGPNSSAAVPFLPEFTGTLQVDRGRMDSSPDGLGGIVRLTIGDGAQFLAWTGTYNQPIQIAGNGWGEAGYPGALRAAGGSNTNWAGEITLTANAGMMSQDTGSTLTLSGVIGGTGNLTRQGPGVVYMTGSASNTFVGTLVLDTLGGTGSAGTPGTASTYFGKTDGAVVVPAGGAVIFGAGTTGQGNLRMQANQQFGAGVVMTFNNANGNWARFDLAGTTQTLAGLNAGTLTSGIVGAVVQNVGIDLVGTQAATLVLNGSGSYLYNGYLRDQDSGNTYKLNLVKEGSGTQTLVSTVIDYTGTTTVRAGRLVFAGNDDNWTTGYAISSGATVEINRTAGVDFEHRNAFTLTGAGTLEKTGDGLADMNFDLGSNVAMDSGALIHVKQGTLRLGYGGLSNWSANKSDLTIETGAVFDLWDNNNAGVFVDALNGGGSISRSNYGQTSTLTVGVDQGSGTFTGSISNASGTTHFVKTGTGVQVLAGASSYSGTTTVAGGKLLANNPTGSATGSGAVTVGTGAILGGTGAVSGTVTVSSGASLAPGASVGAFATGALTLAAGSTMAVEYDSSGTPVCDTLNVTGDVALAGALMLTDLAASPASIVAGTKFTLISYTGALTGTFAGLAEGATITVGINKFTLRYADSNKVTLESTSSAGAPYDAWASSKGLTAANNGKTQDPDRDGLNNLLEFYLDGNPLANDPAIRPAASTDATYLKIAFKRRDDAEADVSSQLLQYGTNLSAWPKSVTLGAASAAADANGVIVTVVENAADPDSIQVQIPRTQAVSGKLFGRLQLTKP